MAKQKSAHEIISALIDKGWCYRQLHECYGLSISALRVMANNAHYNESAATRDILNSKKPTGKPRWGKAK